MLLNERDMHKMSEANIISQYSVYLQDISLGYGNALINSNRIVHQEHFLEYEEFKEYYILSLVGKTGYIDKMASKLQEKLINGVI